MAQQYSYIRVQLTHNNILLVGGKTEEDKEEEAILDCLTTIKRIHRGCLSEYFLL